MLSLGVYPDVTLKAARTGRDRLQTLLKKSIDPSQNRQKEKLVAKISAETSFEEVARLWWADWKEARSERHAHHVLRRLEADVFPVIQACNRHYRTAAADDGQENRSSRGTGYYQARTGNLRANIALRGGPRSDRAQPSGRHQTRRCPEESPQENQLCPPEHQGTTGTAAPDRSIRRPTTDQVGVATDGTYRCP